MPAPPQQPSSKGLEGDVRDARGLQAVSAEGGACALMGDQYRAVADDPEASARRREASMLITVAENHLENDDYDEALSSAREAVTRFESAGDTLGTVDAQRIVASALCGRAKCERFDGKTEACAETLDEAEMIASEQLCGLEGNPDKRGEAAMKLALAEVKCARGDVERCEEAVELAEEALGSLVEIGDARLEATACVVLGKVRLHAKQIRAAKRAGTDAIKLFKAIGDRKQEGLAWGRLGAMAAMDYCYEEAQRCGRKQLKIALELEDTTMEASALQGIAQWALLKGDGKTALNAAGKLLPLAQAAGRARRETSAAVLLVEAHVANTDQETAIATAEEHAALFRERGDLRHTQVMLHYLALANQAGGNHQEALDASHKSLELAAELGLKTAQARVLETMAYTHVYLKNEDQARDCASRACDMLSEVNVREAEAKARMYLLARILVMLGDYPEAVKVANVSLRIARELGDRALEGQALLAVCVMHGTAQNFDKALKAGELAADVFREVGGTYLIEEAKTWQTLGELHLAMGEPAQGLNSVQQAESLLVKFGDQRRLARMICTRVRILLASQDFQAASKAAQSALKIGRSEDDRPGIMEALFLVIEANVECMTEAAATARPRKVLVQICEKTLRYAREAVAVSMKLREKRGEAAAYQWVAQVLVLAGNYDDAKKAAEDALKLYEDLDDRSGQAHATTVLSQVDMHAGNSKVAAETLKRAAVLAKESGNEQVLAAIAELEKKMVGERSAAPAADLRPVEDLGADLPSAGGADSSEILDVYVAPDAAMVKNTIMDIVSKLTGGSDEVDGDTPMMDFGIDSLASVELRTQLQAEFKMTLPSTVMFNYPTIGSMTDLLVDECTNKKVAWSA